MAEKKKILYIVEAMGGGVFTYIVDLANELVNSYDMYIAYAVRKQTPQNYKDYFDKRIHLIEVKNFGRVIDPAKDIAAFFEVKKIAAKIKPDVIHLHSSKAGAIGRVAFNGKIPMFYTPHGYSFLMENYKPMKRRMFKVIESVCAKRNCTTISCSVGEHQESLKLTKHATYVNNGINMAELQEIIDKTEKVEHPFTVYTLGRICYQKNPTLFNEIAESLPDVKFVWIGDGELRDQLTSENIEITGWADRSTAIRYAVNADVFLLPSRWEGLPISLLESMYMNSDISMYVSAEQLRDNDYVLSMNRYIVHDVADGMAFGDVIKRITRGAQLNAKALDEITTTVPTDMQYLMLANIKNGLIDKELPYLKSIDKKNDKYCLSNHCLILSKNGYPYKIAVAEVKEGQRILGNGNLYIIELDEEKADPYYLAAFFGSEQGTAALRSITVGATIPNIGVEQLTKLVIPIPPIEKQKEIADKYKTVKDEITMLQLKLEKAKNRMAHIIEEGGI